MTQEIWKPIKGFEGKYEVSNTGKVRYNQPKILKGCLNSAGYPVVTLQPSDKTKAKAVCIHSLVAEAFIGERPSGLHVAHWNGDKTDNHANNLRYATPKENVGEDRRRHNRLPTGSKNYQSKFTEQTAARIKFLEGVVSSGWLAKQFTVDKATIQRIWNGQNWKHAKGIKEALA